MRGHSGHVKQTQTLMAAHAAMQAGRLDEARNLLLSLLRSAPSTGQAQHLLALVERRRGDAAAARAAFVRAAALTPSDPQLHNNFGNFLDSQGEPDAAIARYDRAIALKPDFADAHLNMAIVTLAQGSATAAEQSARRAIAISAGFSKAWMVLGQALRAQERLRDSAAALDKALDLEPTAAKSLMTRALVAAERGEKDALQRFGKARAASPADRGLLMAETALRISGGDPQALDGLEQAVIDDPLWILGQSALAKARFEAGDGMAAFSRLEAAIAAEPGIPALWMTLINLEGTMRTGPEMVQRVRAARAALGPQLALDVAEAEFALRGDLPEQARPIMALAHNFAALQGEDAESLGRVAARAAIRLGEPERASAILDSLRSEVPALRWDMGLWAHSETAWRLSGDARHAWLTEHPGLWRTHDLPLSRLDALANSLRTLHQRKAHPLDQSLRGGSQTEGTLFMREDPEIVTLKAAIAEAVATHVAALPPALSGHPTLDPARREAVWRFSGSWSVRLLGAGFHVAHMHPEGWLSSAFYVALPEMAAEEGWLVLGEPPTELGTGLSPLGRVEPKVGRLALFPSWLWHGTRAFGAGERLTVAFDVGLRG